MLGVVIPCYKRRECLREALDSLVAQTFKRFFVIVVDDHSPEPLEDIVKEYDNKLHIIYQYAEENGGPGVARQIGLDLCYKMNFDLVMFMDSDDMLFPHAIARLTQEINRTGYNIITSEFYAEGKQGAGVSKQAENKTWLHGKIFRTRYLKDNNIRFPSLRTNEDVAFCLKAFELTKSKGKLSETLYLFRYEKSSITRANNNVEERISADYLLAIYDAAKFLYEKGIKSAQILQDTIGCYNHYQISNICNLIREEHREALRFLINHKHFQKLLAAKNFVDWTYCIRSCYKDKNQKVHYFNQTFGQWLEEFNENSNN